MMSIGQQTNAREFHVDVAAPGQNAIDLLQSASRLSRGRLKDAMTKGAVWLTRGCNTQRIRRSSRILRSGDALHLYFNETVLNEVPPMPQLVADKGDYSVWNKPHGLRSQGSKWGDHCTLVRIAEQTLNRTAYTVHRLDRAASGLILVAHNRKTAAKLSALFRERKIEKRYVATVVGQFPQAPSIWRVDSDLDGKSAVSEISFANYNDATNTTIVDVRIETGRKHQVRRHLAGLGFPILGDRLYGGGDSVDLQLLASQIGFDCPSGEGFMTFDLPQV